MENIDIQSLKSIISEVEDLKYKDIFNKLINIIDELNEKVSEIEVRQESLEEDLEYIDKDIIGIQDELFEEVSIEDIIEMEDEYVEINCKHCNKPLFVEKDNVLNNDIPCPFCNKIAN